MYGETELSLGESWISSLLKHLRVSYLIFDTVVLPNYLKREKDACLIRSLGAITAISETDSALVSQ